MDAIAALHGVDYSVTRWRVSTTVLILWSYENEVPFTGSQLTVQTTSAVLDAGTCSITLSIK